MTDSAPQIDPAAIDPLAFARSVAETSDENLLEGMQSDAREFVLEGIFSRMADHIDPEKASGLDAVVHWRIGDRPDGGDDLFEAVIRDGSVTIHREATTETPRVTMRVGAVDFLKLVTGNESGPKLFMFGRLKLEGDLIFAARMASLFHIPGA